MREPQMIMITSRSIKLSSLMLQEEAEDSAVRDDLVKKKQKSSEPDMIAAGYICNRIWTNLKNDGEIQIKLIFYH